MARTGIERHWYDERTERLRAMCQFNDLTDNEWDQLYAHAMGITLGPVPREGDYYDHDR